MEQGLAEQLPQVTGFSTTINGCLAMLHKQHGNEKSVGAMHPTAQYSSLNLCRVMVELDTHSSIEVMSDELGGEGQTDSEEVGVGGVSYICVTCNLLAAFLCSSLHCHYHKCYCKCLVGYMLEAHSLVCAAGLTTAS